MMKKGFEPDFRHVVDAAYNRAASRLPLYEHGFDVGVVEKVIGQPVRELLAGTFADRVEGLRRVAGCAIRLGYDCVPFERGLCSLVQGGRGLTGHADALIHTMDDLERYPWASKCAEYIALFDQDFAALRESMPEGMLAVGGVGNGLFETIQDFVPYQQLVYLQMDEPEVYAELWQRIGDMMIEVWSWMLSGYGDAFAVCRFGDDLGFRSSTLLQPDDIRRYVLPQYKRIVDLIHSYGKPFLLHSCGNIHAIMDDIIATGIDAKHSNEDAIDTFDVWVTRYGDRIGNFGGVEMNMMSLSTPAEVKQYVHQLLPKIVGHGGIAIGTGNQISPYTEPANWIAMTEAVREFRGEC